MRLTHVLAGILLAIAPLPVPGLTPPAPTSQGATVTTVAVASAAAPSTTRTELTTGTATATGNVAASAVATSDCAGCRAAATTVSVLRWRGPGPVLAANAATAWSSCSNCSSRAVSVQVVLVPTTTMGGDVIRADNRALALNVDCTGCRTEALAVQVVLDGDRTITRAEVARWRDWAAELAATTTARNAAPTPPADLLGGLSLRSVTVRADAG